MKILNDHPNGNHPFAISLDSLDTYTASGVPHRALLENGHNDVFLNYMVPALQKHHLSPNERILHQTLIESLKIHNAPCIPSPFPQNDKTQRGNFAEIFLAEYLKETSDFDLPIYRLRYNPNPDQSMKGDDVLMFDLDSDPVRIIVGEAKFRSAPTKAVVQEMVGGLVRSNKLGLPSSLMFVANRLFGEGKPEIGKKICNCALKFALGKLEIDYVGLLMSNSNAQTYIDNHTSSELHNLLVISLAINNPSEIVSEAFKRVEE